MLYGFIIVLIVAVISIIGWFFSLRKRIVLTNEDYEGILEFRKNLLGSVSGYVAWYFGVDLEDVDDMRISFSKPNPYSTLEQLLLSDTYICNVVIDWKAHKYYVEVTQALENSKNKTRRFVGHYRNGEVVNFEKLGDWLLKNFPLDLPEPNEESAEPDVQELAERLEASKEQMIGLLMNAFANAPQLEEEELKESYFRSLMVFLLNIQKVKDKDLQEELLLHLGKELLYIMKFNQDQLITWMMQQIANEKDKDFEANINENEEKQNTNEEV